MNKKEILDDLLRGKLEVKDVVGRITTRDIADSLYGYSKKLYEFSDNRVVSLLSSLTKKTEKESVFIDIFYRMHLWMKSIVIQNHLSYLQGVALALRSLFELFLDMKLLIMYEKEKSIEKYVAFSEIEMFREAKKTVEFYEKYYPQKKEKYLLQKEYISNSERIERITKSALEFWKIENISKIKNINHWSNEHAEKRAELVGDKYLEIYIEMYSRLSKIIHGSGREFIRKLNKEGFESYFYLCHQVSQKVFIEALKMIATIMQIDKAWEHEGYYKILEELKKENLWGFLLYKLEEYEKQQKTLE